MEDPVTAPAEVRGARFRATRRPSSRSRKTTSTPTRTPGGRRGAAAAATRARNLFAPDGTPLYSITAGKVVPVSGSDADGWNKLGGWATMIEAIEDVGPVKAGDKFYYAHLLEPSPLKPGDTVQAGDVIGKVGSTGEGPQGSILPDGRGEHLHLGWYEEDGTRSMAASGAMNPFPLLEWLRENGGTATGTGGGVALGAPGGRRPSILQTVTSPGPRTGVISRWIPDR